MTEVLRIESRFEVDDPALSRLHAQAFGGPERVWPWAERLARHSVSWVGAFDECDLVGFVHACWDGGVHAFLLDAVVRPDRQRRGVGRRLVARLVVDAAEAGCEWLHVDFESRLAPFYERCGFGATAAALMRLGPSSTSSQPA